MSVSRAHIVLGSLFTLGAVGTTAHGGVVINPDGAGLEIEVEQDGSMQVRRGDAVQLAGPGIVGAVADRAMRWDALFQSEVTGEGTDDEPYQLDTVLTSAGAKLLVRLAYVAGEEHLDIALQLWSYSEKQIRLYHLIDSRPNDPAQSYWTGDAASPSALGIDALGTSIELVATTTAFGHFHAGESGMPAQLAAIGADLGDELDAGGHVDRSLGVQWSFGDVWPLISYQLRFSGAVCGDGVVASGVEACDDGNNVSGDECTATCKVPERELEDPETGFGTSPNDEPGNDEPDDGWGSDDVGPPPGGIGPREVTKAATSSSSDGDEPGFGSATDDEALGCSAGGGSAGGGMLVLLGLAAMVRRRRK